MRKQGISARAREVFGLYDRGLADARALMSLKADELRWAVRMKRPMGVQAGSMPTTKADMAEWLMESMPPHRVSYRVRFADPVPVGAVEVKVRADAAVAAVAEDMGVSYETVRQWVRRVGKGAAA